ncbi:Alpha/beta hydrolase fold-3 domain-containing protein [Pseudozyma hubeiensis]|nr:Alpha/beta hydrolase fold-3 domain-containing protein [Pseudozyma hubeiensis]
MYWRFGWTVHRIPDTTSSADIYMPGQRDFLEADYIQTLQSSVKMSNIVLEPAAQSFAEATSKPPFLFQIPPEEGRKIFDDVQKESINYADGITTEVIAFPDFSSKLIKPKTDNNAILPVVFYVHGGGWVFGSPNAFGRLLGEISKRVNAAVFAVDYTRSPEAKYPTALDQVWQAFEYILANGEKHNVDSARIAIAGDSVGGNMAAVTALKDAGHRLRGQALLYPVCDFSFESGSYNDFAKGYFLQRDAMKWFFEQYSTGVNDAEPNNSRISVLRTTKEVLSKAPPALILTAEADVLRDHAEEFASKLRSAGVQVTSARLGGIIHDFLLLDPLKDTGAARAGRTLLVSQLQEWLK